MHTYIHTYMHAYKLWVCAPTRYYNTVHTVYLAGFVASVYVLGEQVFLVSCFYSNLSTSCQFYTRLSCVDFLGGGCMSVLTTDSFLKLMRRGCATDCTIPSMQLMHWGEVITDMLLHNYYLQTTECLIAM